MSLALLRTGFARWDFRWFAFSAVASLYLGFVAFRPATAETLIAHGGYYYIAGVFAWFVFYLWRLARAAGWSPRGLWRRDRTTGLFIVAASLFAIWCDPFKHKILFDEYVLEGTAYHMHATKEVGTIVRAYDIWGTWLPIDTFLDKRPYFFTFLVSLVHDLTGYRLVNAFAVNVALTPVFLGLVYWLARALAGRRPALLAVALLATMPLLGQQSTGAGMELHNLAMLAAVAALAVHYLRSPASDRLAALVLGTVLLAESRYESVIFVVPVAIVIVCGWVAAGAVFLPLPAIVAPLLLVPYAWHQRVVDATPLLWQLHEGETSRFALRYLAGNLEGAVKFFFNFGPTLANSWYLSLLGVLGLGWTAGAAASRRLRPAAAAPAPRDPAGRVLLLFGLGIAANLGLLMFYYWSRLDDVVASRFALPACFLLALLAAQAIGAAEARGWRATRHAALGLAVWVAGWGLPAIARHTYTTENLVLQEVEWEHDQLAQHPGPLLFISNKSTIPFVLWHVPTVLNASSRLRVEQIKFHLAAGTFREIIVAQALRPTTAQGDLGVDPEDVLPGFRLETITEKRFGGRWARLSRLVAIDPVPVVPTAPAAKAKAASAVRAPLQ